jgi:hypothetical protein
MTMGSSRGQSFRGIIAVTFNTKASVCTLNLPALARGNLTASEPSPVTILLSITYSKSEALRRATGEKSCNFSPAEKRSPVLALLCRIVGTESLRNLKHGTNTG